MVFLGCKANQGHNLSLPAPSAGLPLMFEKTVLASFQPTQPRAWSRHRQVSR